MTQEELREILGYSAILDQFIQLLLQPHSQFQALSNFKNAMKVFHCLAYIKTIIIESAEILNPKNSSIMRAPNGMAFHLNSYRTANEAVIGLGELVQSVEAAILVVQDNPYQIKTVIQYKILESDAGCMEMRLNEFIRYAAVLVARGDADDLNSYMADCMSLATQNLPAAEKIKNVVTYFHPHMGDHMQVSPSVSIIDYTNLNWQHIQAYLVDILGCDESDWFAMLPMLLRSASEIKRDRYWVYLNFKTKLDAILYFHYIKSVLSDDLASEFAKSRIRQLRSFQYGFKLKNEQFHFLTALLTDYYMTIEKEEKKEPIIARASISASATTPPVVTLAKEISRDSLQEQLSKAIGYAKKDESNNYQLAISELFKDIQINQQGLDFIPGELSDNVKTLKNGFEYYLFAFVKARDHLKLYSQFAEGFLRFFSSLSQELLAKARAGFGEDRNLFNKELENLNRTMVWVKTSEPQHFASRMIAIFDSDNMKEGYLQLVGRILIHLIKKHDEYSCLYFHSFSKCYIYVNLKKIFVKEFILNYPVISVDLLKLLFGSDKKNYITNIQFILFSYAGLPEKNLITGLLKMLAIALQENTKESIQFAAMTIMAYEVMAKNNNDPYQMRDYKLLEECLFNHLQASIIKTIRVGEHAFFREFVLGATRSPVQRIHQPLRVGPKKTWTVDASGVILRADKKPLYPLEKKLYFSQQQSCSLAIDVLQNSFFGHTARSTLAGIKIDLRGLYKAYLLGRRFFARDVGTHWRPYDFDHLSAADNYYLEKVNENLLFNNFAKFVSALIDYQNKNYYNEIHLLLSWHPDFCSICIFEDNLESRLLAQDYARIIAVRAQERDQEFAHTVYHPNYKLPTDYKVRITYYLPGSDKNNSLYTESMQEADCRQAVRIFRDESVFSEHVRNDDFEFLLGLSAKNIEEALDLTVNNDDKLFTILSKKSKHRHLLQSLIEKIGSNRQFFADLINFDVFSKEMYPIYLCIVANVAKDFFATIVNNFIGTSYVLEEKINSIIRHLLMPAMSLHRYEFVAIMANKLLPDGVSYDLMFEYKVYNQCLLIHLFKAPCLDKAYSFLDHFLRDPRFLKTEHALLTIEYIVKNSLFAKLEPLFDLVVDHELRIFLLIRALNAVEIRSKEHADFFNALLNKLNSLHNSVFSSFRYFNEFLNADNVMLFPKLNKNFVRICFAQPKLFDQFLTLTTKETLIELIIACSQEKNPRILNLFIARSTIDFKDSTPLAKRDVYLALIDYYIAVISYEQINTFFFKPSTKQHENKINAAMTIKSKLLNQTNYNPLQITEEMKTGKLKLLLNLVLPSIPNSADDNDVILAPIRKSHASMAVSS